MFPNSEPGRALRAENRPVLILKPALLAFHVFILCDPDPGAMRADRYQFAGLKSNPTGLFWLREF